MTADKEAPLAISCHPRLYRSSRILRPNAKQKDMGECYRVPHSTQDSVESLCAGQLGSVTHPRGTGELSWVQLSPI